MMKKIFSSILVFAVLLNAFASLNFNKALAVTVLDTPSITNPDDGDEIEIQDLKIRWSSVDGAEFYRLSIKDMTSGKVILDNAKVTSRYYTLSSSDLKVGHSIKIAVGAYNNNGGESYWAYSTFSVKKEVLDTPQITAPANGARLDKENVKITWNEVDNATYYRITIRDNTDDSVIIENKKVTSEYYTLSSSYLTADHTFKVAVGAYNDNGGESYWDDIYFTIAAPPVPSTSPDTPTQKIYKLSGYITDNSTGNGLSDVTVKLNNSDKWTTTTSSSGYYEFNSVQASTHTLTATKPGYANYQQNVDVYSNTTKNIRMIGNSSGAKITGVVKDNHTGAAIPGVKITLNNDSNWQTSSNSNGYFEIDGMANGTHDLVAYCEGYLFVDSYNNQISKIPVTISAGADPAMQTILMTKVGGTYEIYGTVTDSVTGKAIAGATITPVGSPEFKTTSDETGLYRIIGVASNYSDVLTISKDGYISGTQNVYVSGRNVKLDISISPKQSVYGVVYIGNFFDSNTSGTLNGAAVWLNSKEVEAAGKFVGRTDSSGRYSISDVTSSTHSIYAQYYGYVMKNSNMTVTPKEGSSPCDIIMIPEENVPSEWAMPIVTSANQAGLLTDATKVNFGREITRAEFCEMAMKLYDKLSGSSSAGSNNMPFSDCGNCSSTQQIAIARAYSLGIVNGVGSGKFAPETAIQRQYICVLFLRLLQLAQPNLDVAGDALSFADKNQINSDSSSAVSFMYKYGIVNGTGNERFTPTGGTSVEAAIKIMMKILENQNNFKKVAGNGNSSTKDSELEKKIIENSTFVQNISLSFGNYSMLRYNDKAFLCKNNHIVTDKDEIEKVYANFMYQRLYDSNGDRLKLDMIDSLKLTSKRIDIANTYDFGKSCSEFCNNVGSISTSLFIDRWVRYNIWAKELEGKALIDYINKVSMDNVLSFFMKQKNDTISEKKAMEAEVRVLQKSLSSLGNEIYYDLNDPNVDIVKLMYKVEAWNSLFITFNAEYDHLYLIPTALNTWEQNSAENGAQYLEAVGRSVMESMGGLVDQAFKTKGTELLVKTSFDTYDVIKILNENAETQKLKDRIEVVIEKNSVFSRCVSQSLEIADMIQ